MPKPSLTLCILKDGESDQSKSCGPEGQTAALTASFIVAAPVRGSHSERRTPARLLYSRLPMLDPSLDQGFLAAGTDLPEDALDLREGFLYRVEVWGIGRQVEKLAALILINSLTLLGLWAPRLSITMS
jgi:hypothetical protein